MQSLVLLGAFALNGVDLIEDEAHACEKRRGFWRVGRRGGGDGKGGIGFKGGRRGREVGEAVGFKASP
ncbi:unnamed protein product [Linum trigynum]|uniref:Uncharacterized protein n=1 Tax=Linum trigynum TaxID=586398 RepID=A0AAV2DB69_9ROSI